MEFFSFQYRSSQLNQKKKKKKNNIFFKQKLKKQKLF